MSLRWTQPSCLASRAKKTFRGGEEWGGQGWIVNAPNTAWARLGLAPDTRARAGGPKGRMWIHERCIPHPLKKHESVDILLAHRVSGGQLLAVRGLLH